MKPPLRACAAAALTLAVTGFIAAWAGLVPIAASSGHWPVTAWFLHFTMRSSVRTRALAAPAAPDLNAPQRISKGAKHYEAACAACHGSPAARDRGAVEHMTPHPPYLPPRIGHWESAELFWIVKHGVKFTGMPAWPSQKRDDEVWSMVAFLRRLPALGAAEYRRLTSIPLEGAESRDIEARLRPALRQCARCHGYDGAGGGDGAFPQLTGLTAAYMEASLDAYAGGARHSGVMQAAVAGMSEADRSAVTRYYARLSLPPERPRQRLSPKERRGENIARFGVPEKRVASCIDCHGPGNDWRNRFYPALAGQHENYLLLQLELFQEGRRGGSAYGPVMHESAHRLTTEQARDVAAYYAAQGIEGR